MRLYLMQHGKSKPKDEDPNRPLTDEGRMEVERVTAFLCGRASPGSPSIRHSGKTRARQTAELLAGALPGAVLDEADGLAPLDDPAIWADRLAEADEGVVLVGHLPHLARLVSLLVAGDPEAGVVSFQNGGMVCLERFADGRWALLWSVVPALLG